jgi:4-methylaminobutanoate oxidase (formaldehyde-forming)
VAGGYRAIDSMRLEKGYRVWAADITPDDTPYEAGLGFAVRDDKDFLGAAALREREPDKRLCCVVLADPRSVALGNEPVRVGGEVAGRVTTGGFGYTVGRSIAYAYLPPEHASEGTAVEIDVFGVRVPGEVVAEPLYDPNGRAAAGLRPPGSGHQAPRGCARSPRGGVARAPRRAPRRGRPARQRSARARSWSARGPRRGGRCAR